MNRHAWLQKHPTPAATRGEFHWYPEAGDQELRASFVERVRGLEPPAVLWQLEAGRVAWAQVFAATAPLDGRRYVGLVLSVVEDDRPVADLLAMLAPPPAAPWSSVAAADDGAKNAAGAANPSGGADAGMREVARGSATTAHVASGAGRVTSAATERDAERDSHVGGIVANHRGPTLAARSQLTGAAAIARALLTGGSATVDDPTSPELPLWIASIECLLPDLPGKRCGAWRAADAGAASPGGSRRSPDRVADLVAAAWRAPGSPSARAWALLCELADVRGESVDQVGVALETIDAGAVLTAAERADVVGCDRVVDVLQAWGRGRLDRSQAADTLAARLADLVALRVLARLAAGGDGGGAIAEARWYALLPAQRRTALLAAVARRTASLRTLVEAHHA